MAGFIDIACNFTHPSFAENIDKVLQEADAVDVHKFVLLCASLKDLDPIQKIQHKDDGGERGRESRNDDKDNQQ